MGYGFNKININVLKFDCTKDIDKIRFNHFIMRKENLNRIKLDFPKGQFTLTISSVMKELDLSRGKVQRLIKEFENLGIIRCVRKGDFSGVYSIYEYITGYDIVSDTNQCSSLKLLDNVVDIDNEGVTDTLKKDILKRDLNKNNICINVINYLNKKTGKNFKSTTKKTKSYINARLNEGFKEEDFYKVIDIKSSQWMYSDMNKFLRPSTLFSNNFEGYLNEVCVSNDKCTYESKGWDIEFEF